jgi:hypothetical protein
MRKIASGFHHEGAMARPDRRVIEGTRSEPSPSGAYRAEVEYRSGEWIKKREVTFFPRSWSRSEVIRAIKEVNEQRPENHPSRYWEGEARGVQIGIYVHQGLIVAAHPICWGARWEKSKVNKFIIHCVVINWMRLHGYDAAFVQITREPVKKVVDELMRVALYSSVGAIRSAGEHRQI